MSMSALDYEEIRQLLARYAHALDFQSRVPTPVEMHSVHLRPHRAHFQLGIPGTHQIAF
jgi:hypothetical protein